MDAIPGDHLLVVIHIASHAVTCTVAQLHPEDPARGEQVIAHKAIPCDWRALPDAFRREVVRDAIRSAEDSAGVDIHSAFVSMNDQSMRSHPSMGWAALGDDVVLTAGDVATALRRSREQATGFDRELVDSLPTTWLVRDHHGEREVADPAGQRGHHLTCHSVLVTARSGHRGLVESLCDGAGIELEGIIAQPLALYRGIAGRLRSRGSSLVVDCGGRTTTVLVRRREKLVHIEVHPFGGDDLTDRIADALDIGPEQAEPLKHEVDLALPRGGAGDLDGQQLIFADLVQESRQLATAAKVCHEEADRFFRSLAEDLRGHGMLAQAGAIHLVGRGALLRGLPGMLRGIFDLPVVLGSGDKEREPVAELEGLLISGLVRIAAERRRAEMGSRTDLRRHASGLWNWLAQRLG